MTRPNQQVYRCQNADCGCEMTVTRVPKHYLQNEGRMPVCLCGCSMDPISPPPSPALLL